MKQLNYTLSFTTPAFLGNAEQNGQWRTPPIKALIRQWWRVAYATDHRFQVKLDAMRRDEGLLFGNAWLSHQEGGRPVTDHCKSLVRIRLNNWDIGKLKSWAGLEQGTVHHPETEKTRYEVGPHAYLGFGPLDGRGGTKLSKANAVIQAGEHATLSIAVPDDHAPRIEQALVLMDRYGTLGGRSRNGWGSFSLTPLEGTPALQGTSPLRPWRDTLDRDWPHALGRDDQGALVWQTSPHDDWKSLMKTLALIKIGLRTQKPTLELKLDKSEGDKEILDRRTGECRGINHGAPQLRHWLAYPVTNHSVGAWGNNARLPNSLRFKVRRIDGNKLIGIIFHVPHLPLDTFRPNRQAIEQAWRQVYGFLDNSSQSLIRIPE